MAAEAPSEEHPASAFTRRAARHVFAFAIVVLAVLFALADREAKTLTVSCARVDAATVCRGRTASLLWPRRREVDAADAQTAVVEVERTGEDPSARAEASVQIVMADGADARLGEVSITPRERQDAERRLQAFFRRSTTASVEVTLGPPRRSVPRDIVGGLLAMVAVIGGAWHAEALLAFCVRALRRRRVALPVLVALAALVVVAWRLSDRAMPASRPIAPAPRGEALVMVTRGRARTRLDAREPAYAPAGERLVLAMTEGPAYSWSAPHAGPVRWSAGMGDAGTLAPETGVLLLSPSAPDGASIDILAEVGPERAPYRGRLVVYRRAERPVVGTWRQVGEVPCAGAPIEANRVRRLDLRADGTFGVLFGARTGLEGFRGRYVYERSTGRISLRVDPGSSAPAGFQGEGVARVEWGDVERDTRDALQLEGIWLGGTVPSATPCRLVFAGQL